MSLQTLLTIFFLLSPGHFFPNIIRSEWELSLSNLKNDKKHHELIINVVHMTCAQYCKSSEFIRKQAEILIIQRKSSNKICDAFKRTHDRSHSFESDLHPVELVHKTNQLCVYIP